MPLTKLVLKPGINKEGTSYSNEGGYYNCDKIRFRSGYPEKVGGWRNQDPSYSNTYDGVARGLFNWISYDGYNLLAVGTGQKYYIESGTIFNDITPIRTVITSSVTITVTAGSKVVNIYAPAHGATQGTFIIVSGAQELLTTEASDYIVTEDDVSLITETATLTDGMYEIITVSDADNYTLALPTASTFTASVSGTITITYLLNAGSSTATVGLGWGAGPWGSGGWGEAATVGVTIPLRLWAQDIFNDDLIFAQVGGDIYYWTKDTSTFARAITLQAKSDTVEKVSVLTTAISLAGSTSIAVDSTDGISTGSVISGTHIPAGTYVLDTWDYSLTLPLSAAIQTGGVASGATISVSYAGRHAPNKTNYVVASDTSHFTLVLGSKPYDPTNFDSTYDPMLVRWSDQNNPFEWVPEVTNQSGEQHLSNGSYLICAQNTRQEILIWSDAALYSMQNVGPPYVWGFNLIGDNTSIISPNAAIAVNTVTYWMGVDKFYVYDGRMQTLNCTLWKFVYENLNRSQQEQVVCGSNEGFSEVWWFYPSNDSDINDSYIIYNYLEETWYYGALNRTAWLDSPLRPYPMAAFSIQNSYIDNTGTTPAITATATSIPLVNATSYVSAITYPDSGTVTIDSEDISYTGVNNNTLLNCVRGVNGTIAASHLSYSKVQYNILNQIMFHETGPDDGAQAELIPIPSYLESSDFDIEDGQNFGFMWRMLPDITFRGSTVTNPRVMLSIKARTNSGTAYTTAFTDPTNVTRTSTVPVEQYTGQVYTRVRGRQAAFRIESSDLGTAWQIGVMRVDIKPDGRR